MTDAPARIEKPPRKLIEVRLRMKRENLEFLRDMIVAMYYESDEPKFRRISCVATNAIERTLSKL